MKYIDLIFNNSGNISYINLPEGGINQYSTDYKIRVGFMPDVDQEEIDYITAVLKTNKTLPERILYAERGASMNLSIEGESITFRPIYTYKFTFFDTQFYQDVLQLTVTVKLYDETEFNTGIIDIPMNKAEYSKPTILPLDYDSTLNNVLSATNTALRELSFLEGEDGKLHSIDINPEPFSIVLRDAYGRVKTADPLTENDTVNKKYADNLINLMNATGYCSVVQKTGDRGAEGSDGIAKDASEAPGRNSVALGVLCLSSGDCTLTAGYGAKAYERGCVSFGNSIAGRTSNEWINYYYDTENNIVRNGGKGLEKVIGDLPEDWENKGIIERNGSYYYVLDNGSIKYGTYRLNPCYAEGQATKSRGYCTHTQGYDTIADSNFADASGRKTESHAEYGHAGGYYSKNNSKYGFVNGYYTESLPEIDAQTVFGKYNAKNKNALFQIGNGTSTSKRSNAFEVLSTGRVKAYGAPQEDNDVVRLGDLSALGETYVKKLEYDKNTAVVSGSDAGITGALYGVTFRNEQKPFPVAIQARNWTIMSRDAYGNSQVTDPSLPQHCVTKKYLDSRLDGAAKAISYENYQSMVSSLLSKEAADFNIGQNILIVTLDVPDLWISGVSETKKSYTYSNDQDIVNSLNSAGYIEIGYYKLSALETQKVDLTEYQKDTTINGQSVVVNGVATIPIASMSTVGLVRTAGDYGLTVNSDNGNLTLTGSTDDIIARKTATRAVMIKHIDYAVKVGLTTNTLDLEDAEKNTACEWLGAVRKVAKDKKVLVYTNDDVEGTEQIHYLANDKDSYKPYAIPMIYGATAGKAAIGGYLLTAYPVNTYHAANKQYVDDQTKLWDVGGLSRSSNGIYLAPATSTEINGRLYARKPITIENIDHAVMTALTSPKIISNGVYTDWNWSEEQKANARSTLGLTSTQYLYKHLLRIDCADFFYSVTVFSNDPTPVDYSNIEAFFLKFNSLNISSSFYNGSSAGLGYGPIISLYVDPLEASYSPKKIVICAVYIDSATKEIKYIQMDPSEYTIDVSDTVYSAQ